MPYCAQCGTQIDDTVKFCPECGAKISKSTKLADNAATKPAVNKTQEFIVNKQQKAQRVIVKNPEYKQPKKKSFFPQ